MPNAVDDAPVETDHALVVRARGAGGEEAFAELVRRYRQPVFRLVASILGHGFEAEAEEVTQEVFVRVHGALASFRGDAKFGSWLYRIAFNQALNLKARVRYRSPTHHGRCLERAALTGERSLRSAGRRAPRSRGARVRLGAARGLSSRGSVALLDGRERRRDRVAARGSRKHRRSCSCIARGASSKRC